VAAAPPPPPPAAAAPPDAGAVAVASAAGPAGAVAVLDDPALGAETNGSPEGVDLQVLAKTAALRAEREAIDRALVRFRWNRRKAAQYLNVSYKTLLNKIKECGISETGTE
jgi:two-component system response regulator AtoC